MTLERVVYFQISNLVTGSANVISGKQNLSCGLVRIPFT